MCGISALFAWEEALNFSSLKQMTDLIRHRGPDDEGFAFFSQSHNEEPFIFGGSDTPEVVLKAPHPYCPSKRLDASFDKPCLAALGHRRLSIVDLSPAGHQPLCCSEYTHWITYNGEVYNYIEIREELQRLGHRFTTSGDTEVILKAYKEWGNKCLERFNGMFSFVIYDRKKRLVFAARDRFGVKPLYYWRSPSGFLAIASEIKQFTKLPGWAPKLNPQNCYDYLNWGHTDHNAETLFQQVMQLRGGHFLEISLDAPRLQPVKWYELKPQKFSGSMEDAADAFRALLTDSIRLRLRADVPVGSCLSGGLDSSTIVCLANQLLRETNAESCQKTFSAFSEVKKLDESAFIKRVVAHTGVDNHAVFPRKENLFEEWDDLIWHQDEPFGSASIYAQWLVFKLAKENGVKVMLDGQGADEQLNGYHGFMGNYLYELLASFRFAKLFKEARAMQKLHGSFHPVVQMAAKLAPEGLVQNMRRLKGKSALAPDWLCFKQLPAVDTHPFGVISAHSVAAQSRLQLLHSSVPMLLRYEDRDSMAHSIESRVPFLDYRLVEFNVGLPSEYKMGGGWTKHVLRQSMHGILPEEIRTRTDKIGFATAEEEWVRHESADRFRFWLQDAIEGAKGVLKPEAMQVLEETISGKRPFSFLPFRLICFGRWMRVFQLQ